VRRVLVFGCLVVAGCDYVLRLDPVTVPDGAGPDAACVPVGHDEDKDDLDDACDPCPYSPTNDGDFDGDGIADTCDPDTSTPNRVLLFDGFAALNTSLTVTGGTFGNDLWTPTPTTSNAILAPAGADPVWIVAGVDVQGVDVTGYHEVGVIFDAIPEGNEPAGTYCVLGRVSSEDYVEVYIRDRPSNDAPISNAVDPGLTLLELRQGFVRGRHTRAPTPATSCSFAAGTELTTFSAARDPVPPAGMAGIYASHTTAAFAFLFVVGPQ
jgi:hypothetical protein